MNRAAGVSQTAAAASDVRRLNWRLAGRWLLALALLTLLGAGGVWISIQLRDPYVMPLKLIRIDGPLRHLNKGAVESAVGRVIQGNFFTVDVDQVRIAAESLPWVEKVSVRRIWPGTLLLQVSEQIPLARWGTEQLVNSRGGTFRPEPGEIPPGLPQLSGPEDSSLAVVNRYLDLRPRFALVGLELEQVHMDARRAWRMVFGDGLLLQLGGQDTGRRLDRFLRVYPRLQQISDRRLLGVDLRYTNGFSALWEPAAAEPAGVDKVAAAGRGQA